MKDLCAIIILQYIISKVFSNGRVSSQVLRRHLENSDDTDAECTCICTCICMCLILDSEVLILSSLVSTALGAIHQDKEETKVNQICGKKKKNYQRHLHQRIKRHVHYK